MEWNLSRQFGRFRLRPLQTEDREIEDVRAGQQAAAGPGSAGLVVVGLGAWLVFVRVLICGSGCSAFVGTKLLGDVVACGRVL